MELFDLHILHILHILQNAVTNVINYKLFYLLYTNWIIQDQISILVLKNTLIFIVVNIWNNILNGKFGKVGKIENILWKILFIIVTLHLQNVSISPIGSVRVPYYVLAISVLSEIY